MAWSFQHQVQPFLVKYNRSYSQGAMFTAAQSSLKALTC
ncbi:hypothetical protein GYMC10_6198 [Paenibacillus sp. Y412MC10]|nr:hypothetical protein GYMC10_6198 [Paenibacillus sp. Y412MC10]